MAIFGDLEHLAFGDLAKVLRPQTGTLFLRTALGGRSVELHLHLGELRALFIDGFAVRDEVRLRDTLRRLVTAGSGEFEFQPASPHELTAHWGVQLGELLHQDASAEHVPEAHLPHGDTRFVFGPRAGEAPPALQAAWSLVRPHLAAGVSAHHLASRLGMNERDARVMLHRLRAADLIAPQRAAPAAQPPLAIAVGQNKTQPAAPLTPIGRLLGALRRLTGAVSA